MPIEHLLHSLKKKKRVLKKHVTQICDSVPRRSRNIGTKRDYPYTFSSPHPPLLFYPHDPSDGGFRQIYFSKHLWTLGEEGGGSGFGLQREPFVKERFYWAAVILTYRAMLEKLLNSL